MSLGWKVTSSGISIPGEMYPSAGEILKSGANFFVFHLNLLSTGINSIKMTHYAFKMADSGDDSRGANVACVAHDHLPCAGALLDHSSKWDRDGVNLDFYSLARPSDDEQRLEEPSTLQEDLLMRS